MEPTHYLRIFKRRWWLVALLMVVGVSLGLASTRLSSGDGSGDNFYAATHTLLVNPTIAQEGESADTTNFELIAFLARTGEVPELVAEQLGGDAIRLSSRVALTPNPALGTLEITATGTSGRETEELATTYALTLLDYLAERKQTEAAQQIADTQQRIAELDARLVDLDAQAAAGADSVVIEEEKRLISQDRALLRRELADQETSATAAPDFSTLSEAAAIELGPEEYAAALATIQTEDSDVQSARDAQIQAAQEAASSSDGPGAVTRAGVGGILGLIAGILAVLVLDRFDTRLRTRDDVEEAYGMPVLAEIPSFTRAQQKLKSGEVVSWSHPRSRAAEAFRVLRSAILFAHVAQETPSTNGASNGDAPHDPPPRPSADTAEHGQVLLVSSPGPSEGKTTVTANLSAVLAEAGYRVLALNCDYRRPKLHEQFGVAYEPRRVVATDVPGVSIIADVIDDAHRINPAEAVLAQREVIEKAREMFDVILLDSAPLLTTNDAADLLPIVDMVVVTARGNRTTHEAGFRAAEMLERRDARVVGAVLIDGESKKGSQYYYYRDGYYEDDYTSDQPRPRPAADPIEREPGMAGDVDSMAEGGSHDEQP